MTATKDLVVASVARVIGTQRRGESMALSYTNNVGGRSMRGGRANDGWTWALAAWAEIADREPLVTVAAKRGSADRVKVAPWRFGKVSAWTYLTERAEDRLWGGPARQMIDELAKRGIER